MIVRWTAGLVVTLLLVTAALAVFVLDTNAGARWLALEAGRLSDGAVRLDGVDGTLARGLRADTLLVEAGATEIRADGISLNLDPAQLLRGRVVIAGFAAGRISIATAGADTSQPRPFRMPAVELPLPVEVTALDVATLELAGEAPVQLTGVHFAGSLRGPTLSVRELRAAIGEFALRLAGTAELQPELPVEARVEWRFAGAGVSGAGTIRGDLAALRIEQALRVPDSVRVSATVQDPAGERRVAAAAAAWDAVGFELPGIGPLRSVDGRATLEGTVEDWTATLASQLRGKDLPPMQATAAAHGNPDRIVFDELRLAGEAGTLSATGELALAADQRLQLALTATDVDTAALRPGLEGRFSAKATLDARLPGEAQLRVDELDGRLMGRRLTGRGDFGFREGLLSFRGVTLRAGANRLQANGTLGERLAGRFSLEAPDLALLWPEMAGSLEADASVDGTLSRPVVTLDARGSALAVGDNRAERLGLRMRIDAREQVDAQLDVAGLRSGDSELGELTAGLQGSLAEHRLDARLRNGSFSAQLQSIGRWDGETLAHRVVSATVTQHDLGEWRLAGEPRLAVSAGAFDAGAHCWTQEPASLCVSALSWSAQRAQLTAGLRELDLRRLAPWLPGGFTLAGRGRGDVDVLLDDGVITGQASWEQDDTRLSFGSGEDGLTSEFDTLRVSLSFLPGELTATLAVAGTDGVRIDGSARMVAPPGAAAPLEARFAARMPDVAFLAPLLSDDVDLAEVAGEIALDVAVTGSLRQPRITGSAQLSGGTVALTGLGVKVEDIEVAVIGDGSDVLRLQGSARAGGLLSLEGELRPLDEGGPAGFVRVRGENVDAVRLTDRFIQASPDVTLRYARGRSSVDGRVLIPRADIVVRELPEGAVSPSADTVVVGRDGGAEAGAEPRGLAGEIEVVFGSDVRLRGFGLDTRLAGSVKLSQSAAGEPQGFGVVRLVEGKIGAYGKELTIERGTLGFSGPLDDPVVDLRATRQVDWEGRRVTAGILVRGPATRTQSRVFSEPAMSEADALSFLISGRPLQSADSSERSAISGAALALGVQQTSPLTERVGSAVTLDELGVQGGDVDETEVVAGKQLGSDLYVRFSYGLFNRIGTVLARYRLSRSLSIEAASGEDQSLDLVYTIERE